MASTPSIISPSITRSAAERLGLHKLGITDFWQWWSGELRSAFAPFSARWLHNDDDITDVASDGKSLAFTNLSAAPTASASGRIRVELEGSDAVTRSADDIKRAISAALSGRAKDVRLVISPDMVLQKSVTYPAATLENLRDVVAFDMDRQTPFTAAQVYFDARRAARSVANKSTEANPLANVELIAVPRQTLQPVLQSLREAGASLLSIGVAHDSGSPRFDLLPLVEKPARRITRGQIINLVLLGLIAALVMAAVIVPIGQKRERAIALLPLLQKAQTEAEVTRKIESEFTRLWQEYNFAVSKKYATQPALEVVEELSRISPDTTWLMTLEMKTIANKSGGPIHEVQLMGEAASASKMIELLEQSRLLQNATQRAQTTRGSQPTLERFQIATELRPRALPLAMSLDEMSAEPNPGASAGSTTPAPVLNKPDMNGKPQ